jgi:hypothetical protein
MGQTSVDKVLEKTSGEKNTGGRQAGKKYRGHISGANLLGADKRANSV